MNFYNCNKMVIGFFLATALAAHGNDFSIGVVDSDGTQHPQLSIHTNATTQQVRYIPLPTDIKCGNYRKELCNHQYDVAMIDITAPLSSCAIENNLASCSYDTFQTTTTNALLNDGSKIVLDQLSTTIRVGQLTALLLNGNSQFVNSTSIDLNVQIMGDRADGFDALVQHRGGHFVKVEKSLFN